MVNSLLVAVVSLAAIALFLAFINAIKSRKQAGTGGTNGNDEKWWSMKYLWAIPISLVGIAILWGTFGTSGTPSGSAGTWLQILQAPSLATVVAWKNAYWPPILIALGIVYFLAARAKEKETKETSQAMVAIVAFMLFIGFPVWVWATGPSPSPRAPNVATAKACTETPTETPNAHRPMQVQVAAHGKSEPIPVGLGQHIEATGYGYVLNAVFAQGCNGPRVTHGIVTNKTDQPITVNYEIKSD